MKFKLLKTDGRLLREMIDEDRSLTVKSLADHLKTDAPRVTRILQGTRTINMEETEKIHLYFGSGERTQFLSGYPNRAIESQGDSYEGRDGAWFRLYDEHIQELRTIYGSVSGKKKSEIISVIENLIENHSPKTD